MKLYELPPAYRAWFEKLDEAEGEISEELAHEFAALEGELSAKADSIWALIRELDTEEADHKQEAAFFAAKAKVAARKRDWLKQYLLQTMRYMDVKVVAGKRFTVSRQLAGTPTIRWASTRPIPADYEKVTIELDGKKAQEAYKHGALPEGFKVDFTEFVRGR